jgi:hypothetical protein
MLGLDYSGGRPGGAAIRAAGYGFVCRYLSDGGTRLPGKLLTPGEYRDLMAHGVAVVINWETFAQRMRDGYQAGVADARQADAVARRVGHPLDRPIYFSADWDTTPADQVSIDDYLNGAASVLGRPRVGVYGSYYVCRRCLDNGTATWTWQTGAWSGGQREPRAHIYQRIGTVTVNGVPCDVNESLRPDFGQHLEDDMPTPADLWNFVLPDPYEGAQPKSAASLLGWAATHAAYARAEAVAAKAVAAECLKAVATDRIDVDALLARVDATVKAALAAGVVDVDVTVHDKTSAVIP